MSGEIAPRVVADFAIRSGQPVIAGARVPVALVAGKVAGGMTVAEVAVEYALDDEDVWAAIQYSASLRAGWVAGRDANG